MTTKFRIPQEQMLGSVKMAWRSYLERDPEKAQSDLEDLPVSHAKQLAEFFHFCADAVDLALSRNKSDDYQISSELEEIG